jgi:RecB family exonuclease
VALIAKLGENSETVVALDPGASDRTQFAFDRLIEAVPGASVEATTPFVSPGPRRRAISAADRDGELRAIARDIKDRLTSDRTLRPSDFAVSFRQVAPSLPLARQVFAEYSLPLDPAAGSALAGLPLGNWLRRFLTLGVNGWQVRDLVAVLRSGFVAQRRWQLHRGHVAVIAAHARKNALWSGLDAMQRVADGLAADEISLRREAGERLDVLLTELAPLLDPARTGDGAAFAREIDAALFGRGPIVHAAAETAAEVQAFRVLLVARGDVDTVAGPRLETFAEFVRRLLRAMERPALRLRDAGGVVLAPAHTLHGLRFRYVAIGGLREGEFPAPRRLPGLLDGEVRRALIEAGLPLPARRRASEDELFASAASRAEDEVVFARPRLDGAGRRRAPSHFFPSAESVAEERVGLAPERAASRPELALAAVQEWPHRALRPAGYEPWATVRLSAAVEGVRRSFEGAGTYEGQVPSEAAATMVAPDQRWSASRFEAYNTCGFQFFSIYGLGLSELDRELLQADAATLGTVVHEIVENAIRPLVEARQPLVRATLPQVLADVDTAGRATWHEAPSRRGFGRAGLWQLRWPQVRDRIARMLGEEAEASERLGVTAVAGAELRLDTAIAIGGRDLRFGGRVDRMDAGPGMAVVVDYKSGRPINRADVESGDRMQLALYTAAVRRQLGFDRVVARYAYLRPTEEKFRFEVDTDSWPGSVDAATARAAEILERTRAGRFGVMPGPFAADPARRACPMFCPFKHACRVSPVSKWKQWD